MNKDALAFRDAVTRLSVANGDRRAWWYTWIASRDRFRSRLFDVFLGVEPASGAPPRSGWVRLAKEVAAAIRGVAVARANPARRVDGVDVVIFAPASDAALVATGEIYRDTYFGPLADLLREDGETPLLFGLPVTSQRETVRALARRSDIPATSIYHWSGARDICVSLWQALATRLIIPRIVLPSGVAADRAIRTDLKDVRGDMFFGLLLERAVQRVLAAYPDARVIHTYENNPWEHAVDRAAHEATPRRHVTGYLHCAVLPSHLKNYRAEEEAGLRPEPDRIVCTGRAARDVFLGLGHHDPNRVSAGCALRGPSFAEIERRPGPPSRIGTILAVLEGLNSMADLLVFLAAAREHLSGCRILVRPHPTMPLSGLLARAGVTLDPAGGFAESATGSLETALAEADAVVYVSTTAAMTALAMGIPLIKVRLNSVLEDDPLFACDALKRTVDSPAQMAAAVSAFERMEQTAFDCDCAAARNYLDDYLTPPNEESLAPFRRRADRFSSRPDRVNLDA